MMADIVDTVSVVTVSMVLLSIGSDQGLEAGEYSTAVA